MKTIRNTHTQSQTIRWFVAPIGVAQHEQAGVNQDQGGTGVVNDGGGHGWQLTKRREGGECRGTAGRQRQVDDQQAATASRELQCLRQPFQAAAQQNYVGRAWSDREFRAIDGDPDVAGGHRQN